jgi:hypothetical protein
MSTEGITTTQTVKAAKEPCCNRGYPHVHHVPKKPPVNAAGDVDLYDASNQPVWDPISDTISITPSDPTEHVEIPDFVEAVETETTEEEE